MEDGGHYYTVYYTSLAVGFNEKVAYRHAVLAQMPDEVGWLDAANLHIKECTYINEVNLNGVMSEIPNDWRYTVEYGQHSLPGNALTKGTQTSAFQRRQTTIALSKESPISLKFGLLLHRLGDTYAHSRMSDPSVMYSVTQSDKCFRPTALSNYNNNFGHGPDGHDPDYPFLRQELFISYLQNLYNVLSEKVRKPENAAFRRHNKPRPFHEVRADFELFFINLSNKVRREKAVLQNTYDTSYFSRGRQASEAESDTKANWFIAEIRAGAYRILGIKMNPYTPEKQEGMTLQQFLGQHNELKGLNINSENLTRTINSMMPAQAP